MQFSKVTYSKNFMLEIDYKPPTAIRPEFEVRIQPVLIIDGGIEKTALPPIPKSLDEYMTAEQAAEYIAVHVETLRKWVRLGKFPCVPLPGAGKDYRFSRAMIDEWARKRALNTP